ncbi:MAG: ABC transporter permease [Phycisphaeraceae bacterium]|nr:ABC transporter permease [Phycisphaeraceae bacterium]MCB9848370.1 ABC transporter permease [Phycisphaeraceae bacterium]
MIARQTLAIFLDGYRELNARKLFWIAIILSGLVVVSFALIGSRDGNLSIAMWRTPLPLAALGFTTETLYKLLFIQFGVGFWLAWVSTILALVTTSGMIPEFVAGGAIDLTLSKPIGRVRLFLTKYAAALLFVALQVTTFTAACFVVLGLRGGSWEPGLFLAIPIMIAFFSFLYCVSALVGLLTRSTIAALILALLFWFMLFIFNTADAGLALQTSLAQQRAHRAEQRVQAIEASLADRQDQSGEGIVNRIKSSVAEGVDNDRLQRAIDIRESADEDVLALERWHNRILTAKAVFPKTNETIALLRRSLISAAELDDIYGANSAFQQEQFEAHVPEDRREQLEEHESWADPEQQSRAARQTEAEFRSRSVPWVLGTSLGFEAVILAICCWIFARRDF